MQNLRDTADSLEWTEVVGRYRSRISCPVCGRDVLFEVNNPFHATSGDSNFKESIRNAKCLNCDNTLWNLTEDNRSKTIKSRLNKPQYIGEGRSISLKNAIEDPVKKSIAKFYKDTNNMVIITPNMFGETVGFASLFDGESVREIARSIDAEKVIKKIGILEVALPLDGNFKYRYTFIDL